MDAVLSPDGVLRGIGNVYGLTGQWIFVWRQHVPGPAVTTIMMATGSCLLD